MVGGAGYVAGKHIQEGRNEDAYRDQRLEELEQQQYAAQAAPAAPAAPTGMTDQKIEQLRQIAELHEQGILTDAEFDAQKRAILSS